VSSSLKNISVVSAATMVSRVLGLVRDSLTAAVFGASALASAFYTAFTLPNLFRRLLGEGALTAAFIPVLTEEARVGGPAQAHRLVSQVASWLLAATGLIVAVAMGLLTLAPQLLSLAGGHGPAGETAARWLLAAELAVWLFPYLIFVCLAAAFSAALQTFNRFLEPALSPIWLNCAMIGLLAFSATRHADAAPIEHMRWLCGGVLIGGFLQMLVPALALRRLGWQPRLDLSASPRVRTIIGLMGPTVFGSAIYLINLAVSRLVGLSLDDASVTLLNLATRLMELPIGVFAVAVTTVVFPLISRHAAAGEWDDLARAYRRGMRLILAVNIPAAVGLALLASPLIRMLFQRGAFSAADTAAMAPVLAVFAAGLPFLSFVNLALRAFYARQDTRTPVHAALLSFAVNLALSLALMEPAGTFGLAIAGTVSTGVQAWFLQSRLTRLQPGLAFHHLFADAARIVIASGLMGLAVLGWQLALPATGSLGADVRLSIIAIGTAVPLYGALLWMLRFEGRTEAIETLRAALTRRRSP
jgi:putative peptidoglycan lipid II flippase